MLSNLSSNLTNLKQVEILNYWDLDNDILLEFLQNNPQLTSLKVNFNIIDSEVYNSILSLKYLNYLSINKESFVEMHISNFPISYSITHLSIGKCISDTHSIKLINACINLSTLEFHARDFVYDSLIEWDLLERRIKTLQLTDCNLDDQDIQLLDYGKFFDKARFIKRTGVYNAVGQLKYGGLINYRLLPEIGEFPKMFTIVLRESNSIE
ncbi:hypothetical protein CONCODRAFT_9975 [Conidiobolus coronatus NRRL 28638]|uniref:RNI-like protein n=1 Tax=Conidiobolus coronatus (strain ATCC 28846 / CBS 209.66 / NRRL 28638) TaxID=796925 RepID=A0A137NYN8_CONC2|nr:hypothetical protein CONCODRAFT_9975 [Conidiobolus coronatus NRRL 28638]|eukprot:KXN67877.1 hypothetical protein CONCODRAFT_9975 [Conidiobolus coronatus NRRL 28638]